MKLIGSPASPFVRKIRIYVAERGIACPMEALDVMPAVGPIYRLNPLGKIPCLLVDDEPPLYDSRVIVEYLEAIGSAPALVPRSFSERITVKRLEALADGALDAGILARWELAVREPRYRDPDWIARQTRKMEAALAAMANQLGTRAFCVGDRFTLADIAFGCVLGWFAFRFPSIDWPQRHPGLKSYFDRLCARPSFAATVPC